MPFHTGILVLTFCRDLCLSQSHPQPRLDGIIALVVI